MTPQQMRVLALARARARLQQEQEARDRAEPGASGRGPGLATVAVQAAGPGPRYGESRDAATEVEQGLATFNRGIPFAADVTNVVAGIDGAIRGNGFSEGYRAQQRRNQNLTREFRTRRPRVAAFTEGSGNAVPVIATGGAAAPQALTARAATRGLPLFAQQTARGGATGAAWGATYGAGAGDAPNENWPDRLQSANEGALLGGAFGAAAPTAINAARPVVEPVWRALTRTPGALTRAAERVPTPRPNSVGMSGGNLQSRPPSRPPPAPPELVPEPGRLATLADRAGVTSDDVAAFGERAQRRQGGERLVDTFGDAGVRQLRSMVQTPGRTGQAASEAAERRFAEAPEVIMGALRRRLGVGETRASAMARLGDDYRRMSAELYQPIWQTPMAPERVARLQESMQPLLRTPIMSRAIQRADEMMANDRGLGLITGSADEHFGRWLHYVKMGLDDVISAGRRDGSLASNAYRQANEARAQLLRVMDENIPQYREARSQWAGTAAAEDALEEGAGFLRMLPDEVRARRAQMTPFELEHARIGFADEVRRAVRGQVTGNRNVANGIMNDPDAQRAMAYLFDDPAQAAEFLDIVNSQNRLMRNASQWVGGSPTGGNLAYSADDAARIAADAGGAAARGDVGGTVQRVVGGASNLVTAGAVERSNNRFGEVLLRRIDNAEARAFVEEVVRVLRQREAARRAADAAVAPTAAASGSQQGRD